MQVKSEAAAPNFQYLKAIKGVSSIQVKSTWAAQAIKLVSLLHRNAVDSGRG